MRHPAKSLDLGWIACDLDIWSRGWLIGGDRGKLFGEDKPPEGVPFVSFSNH